MDKASKVEATFYGLLKRVFQEEKKQIDLSNASNIRALLLVLCNSRERRDRIFDEYGNVRQNISIFINGRNILFLKGLETELNAGDSVAIFESMAGGRRKAWSKIATDRMQEGMTLRMNNCLKKGLL